VGPALEQLRTDQAFSSAITCLDRALCEINKALAAAVKAQVLGHAFEGAQRIQRQPTAIDRCICPRHQGDQALV